MQPGEARAVAGRSKSAVSAPGYTPPFMDDTVPFIALSFEAYRRRIPAFSKTQPATERV